MLTPPTWYGRHGVADQRLTSTLGLLDRVNAPEDLRSLTRAELVSLAGEIRTFLVRHVSSTGGHLGPNLGIVEVTLAAHRVFDSPREPFLFDTGHQGYVHKIVTGRKDEFATLRQHHGLSGYPNRHESEHDWVQNSHASTALSYAHGLAKAIRLSGRTDRVLAIVGDGSLTGGMAWEALNNIAADADLPLVVVVNDNGRSYLPTVGGLANRLSQLRTRPWYDGATAGLEDLVTPQHLFSDLGLRYIGPVDGHDVAAVERALAHAHASGGTVLVHCLTEKGHGFAPAVHHAEDQFHAVGPFSSATGQPLTNGSSPGWTEVFGEHMVTLGRENPRLVAITAAMTHPTGLHQFARAFPDRCYDVGIAEQHAVTCAAGLALGGMHPVVAVYSTFMNRAFDQVLLDVALHRCGVTFVLDRAGITGPDGSSHHGMWDLSWARLVPGLRLAAPRDATRLREALTLATTMDDGPSVVRFPRGSAAADLAAVGSEGGADVMYRRGLPDVLVVALGPMVQTGVDVGRTLAARGVGVTVVDPVWALPVDPVLVELASRHRHVVTIEDSCVVGGWGEALACALRTAEVTSHVRLCGIPLQFVEHGGRAELLEAIGLTAERITAEVWADVAPRLARRHPRCHPCA